MNVPLFILGLILGLLSLLDALWTALWVDGGAGPVTGQITNGIWWVMRNLVRTKRNYWLSLAGPLTQTVTVLTWIGLLWMGWLLMFSADPTSLVYDRTPEPQPTTLIDRIYFVAYTISTVGNGDMYPSRGGWEIVTYFKIWAARALSSGSCLTKICAINGP
ncbi:ion channel [Nodosilinea sp. E11]|uniref:ion channel n=1 Tax=Nodosilinea sp. E11 TaxID=3037479 RepID=UPI00293532CF|nr:ion channel [Nodosilinea sp. E11]WOD38463.1 ion channel [Nodosilinea sp. E11]